MSTLIIPARGGSKGIPRKNLAKVHGVSLVERAIITAKRSTASRVILSTDDEEIAKIGLRHSILIHKRSLDTGSDSASTESVISEVIKDFRLEETGEVTVGFIQPTSPFLGHLTIDKCIELANLGNVGFTATESHYFRWKRDGEKWIPSGHPTNHRPRRQDLDFEIVESGGCFFFPISDFQKMPYRFCANPMPVIISFYEGLDIDSKEDLDLANSFSNSTSMIDPRLLNLSPPRLLVTDFDGCLTNDRVSVDENGIESIQANRKDGLAAKRIQGMGVRILILSSEENPVVTHRAKKMGVGVIQGSGNKLNSLLEYLDKESLTLQDVWFVGNDMNDFEVLKAVKFSFCPIDAVDQILENSSFILSKSGGEGILAEILTYIQTT
jgi:N-acylneuraminate cytidylyltransferase